MNAEMLRRRRGRYRSEYRLSCVTFTSCSYPRGQRRASPEWPRVALSGQRMAKMLPLTPVFLWSFIIALVLGAYRLLTRPPEVSAASYNEGEG